MSGSRLYVRCTVATLALGLILVGCNIVGILSGDDTNVPDVDITGTYEGTFIGLGRDAGGSEMMDAGECTLRLTLDSQSDDEVSGSFVIGDRCSGGAEGELTGTLCEVPDRTVRCTEDRIFLTLSLTSGGDAALVALTDCEHSDGNSALTGAVRGGNIALASRFQTRCPDDGDGTITVVWAFVFDGGLVT